MSLTQAEEHQLIADYQGANGPQRQQVAAQFMEEEGLEWVEAEDDGDEAWTQEAMQQIHRLEGELGRPLSTREINTLMNDQAGSDFAPDMKEAYDRVIGRDLSDKDARQAVGAEVYEETRARNAAGEIGEEWDPASAGVIEAKE